MQLMAGTVEGECRHQYGMMRSSLRPHPPPCCQGLLQGGDSAPLVSMAMLDKIRRHSVVMHNLLQPLLGQRVEGDVKNLLLEIMPIAKAPFQVCEGNMTSPTCASIFHQE